MSSDLFWRTLLCTVPNRPCTTQHFPTFLPISPSSFLRSSQGRSLPSTFSANRMIVDNPQAMVCISLPKGWGLRTTHIQAGQVYLIIHSCVLSSITLTQEASNFFVKFAFYVSSILNMWNNMSLYVETLLSVYDRLRRMSSNLLREIYLVRLPGAPSNIFTSMFDHHMRLSATP